MTSCKLLPQNLSGELDGRRSVSDHRGRARDIREHRNSDALMRHAPNNTHHAFARVFECCAADVNVLDVHGFHQFPIPHVMHPKANHYRATQWARCGRDCNLNVLPVHYGFGRSCKALAVLSARKSPFGSIPRAETRWSRVSFDSCREPIPTISPSEKSRAANTTSRFASRHRRARALRSSPAALIRGLT